MFSVEQKRSIADAVQKILRDVGHPELPTVGEINFRLHVEGRVNWSWADIQNNAAVPIPSINPHNEAQVQNCTPTDPQHGRDVKPKITCGCETCVKSRTPKPLAQYLAEYIEHEHFNLVDWRELLEQALDAYQSTENVKIRIEPA